MTIKHFLTEAQIKSLRDRRVGVCSHCGDFVADVDPETWYAKRFCCCCEGDVIGILTALHEEIVVELLEAQVDPEEARRRLHGVALELLESCQALCQKREEMAADGRIFAVEFDPEFAELRAAMERLNDELA